jgi:hypothetical protein
VARREAREMGAVVGFMLVVVVEEVEAGREGGGDEEEPAVGIEVDDERRVGVGDGLWL